VPGFQTGQEDFDRIYITEEEVVNQYFGSTLFSWGLNTSGQLGQNIITSTNRSSPVLISGGGNTWKTIDAGREFAAAIKTDGTLWTWGSNNLGQLGTNTTVGRSSPQTTIVGGNDWKSVTAAGSSILSIKTDGTRWGWGDNSFGQLGNNTNTTYYSFPTIIDAGDTTWKQLSMGEYLHASGIKTNGTLWTWGVNAYGALGSNNTIDRSSPQTTVAGGTSWKQVSSGYYFNAAIKTDGTLWTWGDNFKGNLGNNNIINRSSPQTTVAGGNNWKTISSSKTYYSLSGIKTDGTLWTWGDNFEGELGSNNTVNRSSPGTVSGGGTDWKSTYINSFASFAIKTDGTLWAWGYNSDGQLGTNNTILRSSPQTIISGNQRWKFVSIGGDSGTVSRYTPVFAISEDSFSE